MKFCCLIRTTKLLQEPRPILYGQVSCWFDPLSWFDRGHSRR